MNIKKQLITNSLKQAKKTETMTELQKKYQKKLERAADRVFQLKPSSSKTQQYTRACTQRDCYKAFIKELHSLS